MPLWSELRRRHVFRVMAVYTVIAWLTLQLGSIVFPAFHAPDWTLQVLIGFIVLGFPVAFVLAWAFEVTPEGVRRTEPPDAEPGNVEEQRRRFGPLINTGVIMVLTVAVVALGWELYRIESGTTPTADRSGNGSASESTAAKAIAVLPFENLSPDKDNAYFASGMREELLTRLANLEGLKVISSTSSAQYRSHPENLRDVARELGVDAVLEGSVQKAADEVLVNIQLIDAHTDNHIWAESYRRKLADIFTVEGEVAEKVATSLRQAFTPSKAEQPASAPTTNSQAFDAYLRGRAEFSNAGLSAERLKGAAASFREAVQHDPEFGLAWARMAMADLLLYSRWDHSSERLQAIEQEVARAISLAPDNAVAQLAQGDYYYYGLGQYERALDIYRQVVEAQPNNTEALVRAALIERRLGRWEQALDHFEAAAVRDPLNVRLLHEYANTHKWMRNFAAALDIVDQGLAVGADKYDAIGQKIEIYDLQGQFDEADKLVAGIGDISRIASSSPYLFMKAVHHKVLTHQYQTAIKLLNRAITEAGHNSEQIDYYRFALAMTQQAAGNTDAARPGLLQARAFFQRKETGDRPRDAGNYATLGLIEACLGNKRAALEAIDKAKQLLAETTDAVRDLQVRETIAAAEAWAGNSEDAIRIIRQLLSVPSELTISMLRNDDPQWLPLHDDPRFEALVHPRDGIQTAI